MNPYDRILIEYRNQAFHVERTAALDLLKYHDRYFAPSYTVNG